MKQAGVVANPMSKTEHPARERPANTAALNDAPDMRGSLPRETLTSSTDSRPFSKPLMTHSPKLSEIASTAGGVRSTVRPFSPSNATPRTSDPFWSLLILSISSSTKTSLYFAVLEEFTHMTFVKGGGNEKVRVVRSGLVDEKLVFRALPCKYKDGAEVDAIVFLVKLVLCFVSKFPWRLFLGQAMKLER
ncbi:hypothetical protein F2P56_035369 [Juglans regia]|uniref:Uncharacterized protein n=1 Tax=Juglans regia TaxID=51240 RepID=A0A833T405_JUGRE|nr:hypothetical protein F2P56_035369 [Juglans regia]